MSVIRSERRCFPYTVSDYVDGLIVQIEKAANARLEVADGAVIIGHEAVKSKEVNRHEVNFQAFRYLR